MLRPHNFFIVAPNQEGHWQQVPLADIARRLYSAAKTGALMEQLNFYQLNKPLTQAGQVHTGQVLYVPTQAFNLDQHSAHIQTAMLKLNQVITKLTKKQQRYWGKFHYLTSGAIGAVGHTTMDLRTAWLRVHSVNIDRSMQRLADIGRQIGQVPDEDLRAQAAEVSQQLQVSMRRYIRTIKKTDPQMIKDYQTHTGTNYLDEVYDLKRIGVNVHDIDELVKILQVQVNMAKGMAVAGKFLVGISVADAGSDILSACHRYPSGVICYDESVKSTFGLAGALGGMRAGDALTKVILRDELVCNALLDLETDGFGAIACQFVVAGGTMVGAGQLGQSAGKILGREVVSNHSGILTKIAEIGRVSIY